MNRREFVAALVAAGVVCSGFNSGCDKPQTEPAKSASNNNTNAQATPELETVKNSNNLAVDNSNDKTLSENTGNKNSKTGRKPLKDNPVRTERPPELETVRNSNNPAGDNSGGNTQSNNKPRHKPLTDNPAGSDYTACLCEKTKERVDCCYDENRRVIPCPSQCPF
jgi:hypothetical protein